MREARRCAGQCPRAKWKPPQPSRATVQTQLQKDHYSNTSMHWPFIHCAISRLPADYGADMSAKHTVGQSTLLWSALAGKMDAAETLIALGANNKQGDRNGFKHYMQQP